MDHEGARRLMAESMETTLGTDDERELALHLVACPECKAIYEGLQQAHPALESIILGEPSTQAVDAAAHRAATVLRGEADPGPMGLTEEPPRQYDPLDPNTIRIDSGVPHQEEFVPPGPQIATGPAPAPEPSAVSVLPVGDQHTHVRAIEAEPAASEPIEEVADDEAAINEPATDEHFLDVPSLDRDAEEIPPTPRAPLLQTPTSTDDWTLEPTTEVDRLLDAERTRREPAAYEAETEADDRDRMGPGPWLVAIAVTVALAVLAGILITRGEGLIGGGGGGDLPSASDVQDRVRRVFADMKSLKANFEVTKLNLYRVGREEDSLVYSFSNGVFAGRIDYDRAEGYKQNFTLTVKDDDVERAEIVQTTDETRSLLGAGASRSMLVETNPALGPPDGNLRPTFGLLEESLGTAVRVIATADDLEVVGLTERDGREMIEVRAEMRADELSRGDEIIAALDASNLFPVIVKRSISRQNARVLGPSSALTDEALDTAFADNDRITTELIELRDVQYDEIVLPGDLVLEAPDGIEEQTSDARFERVQRPELGEKLDFEPLLPRSLPDGYEEQLLTVYTGEPARWGPNDAYPEPESVFHSSYFDGKTTIVVTQRRLTQRFEVEGSPLATAGVPITVREVQREEGEFFYGHSPESPPHAYGFIGNVFVMATGYAPQGELVRMLASLDETPVEVPGPVGASPSPGTSPGVSPDASPAAGTGPAGAGIPPASPTP